ncbi:hypothetical protein [Kingella sp. (in: b-proteobacteria)]|nr:hypothetical protein [Kingella sp. (in: b-proteobacteria)]MDO4656247.1 hypothetical protein [Kingella sp. (in: b-proteobacteria)]
MSSERQPENASAQLFCQRTACKQAVGNAKQPFQAAAIHSRVQAA